MTRYEQLTGADLIAAEALARARGHSEGLAAVDAVDDDEPVTIRADAKAVVAALREAQLLPPHDMGADELALEELTVIGPQIRAALERMGHAGWSAGWTAGRAARERREAA